MGGKDYDGALEFLDFLERLLLGIDQQRNITLGGRKDAVVIGAVPDLLEQAGAFRRVVSHRRIDVGRAGDALLGRGMQFAPGEPF